MKYLTTDYHIHAKDEEHAAIALYLISTLDQASIYKAALTKMTLDINDYYTSYDSELAKVSKELVKVEALRQHILSLHAHYSKTQEQRSALLNLVTMHRTELYTDLEEYSNEED